ncbi:MAG TPA: shikimate dehydrogenase [Solirubrobacterales bacterium]
MPRLAVIGHPIAHSLSPAMQNAALRELGLAGEWSYEALDVVPGEFAKTVRRLSQGGFTGVNVTIPHKRDAFEIADDPSAAVRAIGAANTLSFGGGRIAAENTDAPGLIAALPEGADGRRALVLGAGGAARAAAWALADAGAEVWVWNRTPERAERLARDLGVRPVEPDTSHPATEISRYELIVNATSVGLEPPGREGADLKALRLDADSLNERHLVVDLVYGSSDTELVRAARRGGANVVDGREVLVQQGAASLRIWTGREPPLEAMRRAIQANPGEPEPADER